MPNVRLRTCDGVEFNLDVGIAKCSTTIATMFDDLGSDDQNGGKDEATPILLPTIDSKIFKLVVEWATYHQEPDAARGAASEAQGAVSNEVGEWDANFLNNLDMPTFLQLMLAVNYLNIHELLQSIYKTMANKISGKRPEEIRILLDIKTEIVHDHEQVANSPNVALETSDGVKYVVDYDVARSIPIIKEMVEEDNGVQDDKIYKLHTVNYDDLLNVLQWVKHHMTRPSPPENARNLGSGDNNAENSWEEEFLNEMDDTTQLALILAAKELGVENLVNAACNKVGNMLKRKTVEEIREGLGIKDDFTDDEREEIRRQNQWTIPEVPPAD